MNGFPMRRAFAGLIALLLVACAAEGPKVAPPASSPPAQAPAAVAAPAAPKLDVTAELMPGDSCSAPGPATFKGTEPFKVSLCISTSLEAFCGSTVKFAPEGASSSGHFELRAIAHHPTLDDPNAKVPFPWPIITPVPTTDLGSTGGNDGLASGKRVRFAVYTVAATARANADRYTISLSPDSSLGLRKGGTCGNAYEAPLSAKIEFVRSG
ncbi:MAG: hypothetical protein JNK75_05300 [Betaproteobacteria bacterium]|nr:hypothetical protein [Betaproteobacteria bacterium]